MLAMGTETNEANQECKMMCTVTKKTLHFDIDTANVDSGFGEVGAILRGMHIRNVCILYTRHYHG
jgi:hypothetical protein